MSVLLRDPSTSVPGLVCTCWRLTPSGAHPSSHCPVGANPTQRRYGYARAHWERVARWPVQSPVTHFHHDTYAATHPERAIAEPIGVGYLVIGWQCLACNIELIEAVRFSEPTSKAVQRCYASMHQHNHERHPRRYRRRHFLPLGTS